MHFFTFIVVLLLGAGVWRLVRVGRRAKPAAPAVRDDVPARLLGWGLSKSIEGILDLAGALLRELRIFTTAS